MCGVVDTHFILLYFRKVKLKIKNKIGKTSLHYYPSKYEKIEEAKNIYIPSITGSSVVIFGEYSTRANSDFHEGLLAGNETAVLRSNNQCPITRSRNKKNR